ncbi:MAG: hypothetical protein A2845_00140 [Candidatus Lloydbacteria bacterium RIFCSPHIGHO2_01_FULL_49_22]|uniref:Uncharacterized protein n=1 Tax=Candidatus Lloydbacteria bacterium RIFCSPHIGHO2_01_FULL_49_22 TaxID=1798658 RepID=A0A1G2CXV7_9BACT|nr:MAG: hypothetical protein A2845_00140 [Candidatus Lloydbacteria bacterium RIFCSPHIGHO2_01_FULL_49_22]OGZ09277.1 MAG: hypothetical protein A3C14_05045 [Candidatus Lloydbacteria bacterium RIFCSPHIGHO2_02_FULL_50_18]
MAYTYTKEDLLSIYRSLPDDLQDVIFSPQTSEYYDAIATKFVLSTAQRKSLSHQSSLLLMGVTQPQQFVIALTDELKISREQAALIAQDLNLNIFNSVKGSLTALYTETTPSTISGSGTASAPQATTTVERPIIVTPTPPTPTRPVGSIFEQKLGGAFRMSSPIPTPTRERVMDPMLVVPPPPTPTVPFQPVETKAPSLTTQPDAYRETTEG